MNKKTSQYRIAVTMITCHFALIITLLALLMADALLLEEFTPLITLLSPIFAIYTGVVSQVISDGIKGQSADVSSLNNNVHVDLVIKLIWIHFFIMLLLLLFKAVFNWIEFSTLTIFMTLIEMAFGGYMGAIMNVLFKSK